LKKHDAQFNVPASINQSANVGQETMESRAPSLLQPKRRKSRTSLVVRLLVAAS
jgi:hypothetical protein